MKLAVIGSRNLTSVDLASHISKEVNEISPNLTRKKVLNSFEQLSTSLNRQNDCFQQTKCPLSTDKMSQNRDKMSHI